MINLTDENFEEEVKKIKKPVLIDFFADWCPSCQVLGPILEKLEKEFGEKIVFAKVDVNLAPQTCQKFRINPIPTVFLLKEGKLIGGFIGLKSEEEIRNWLEELVIKNEPKS